MKSLSLKSSVKGENRKDTVTLPPMQLNKKNNKIANIHHDTGRSEKSH
jgi:hypothetical protein